MLVRNNFKIFIAFCSGIFIGYLSTQWSYFNISKEINLIDVLGIIVNLFLAYFISKILEKKNTEHRIEKDIVIEKLMTISKISSKVLIIDNKFNFAKANSIFKELSSEIIALKNTIDYMRLKLDESKLLTLKSKHLDFKKIVTSQKVNEGELLFEDFTSLRVTITGRKFVEFVSQLIIDCNRL